MFLFFSQGEQLYDNYFELFIMQVTYLHFIGFFSGFYLILSFGTYSIIYSLCLTFCVYSYELNGKSDLA